MNEELIALLKRAIQLAHQQANMPNDAPLPGAWHSFIQQAAAIVLAHDSLARDEKLIAQLGPVKGLETVEDKAKYLATVKDTFRRAIDAVDVAKVWQTFFIPPNKNLTKTIFGGIL